MVVDGGRPRFWGRAGDGRGAHGAQPRCGGRLEVPGSGAGPCGNRGDAETVDEAGRCASTRAQGTFAYAPPHDPAAEHQTRTKPSIRSRSGGGDGSAGQAESVNRSEQFTLSFVNEDLHGRNVDQPGFAVTRRLVVALNADVSVQYLPHRRLHVGTVHAPDGSDAFDVPDFESPRVEIDFAYDADESVAAADLDRAGDRFPQHSARHRCQRPRFLPCTVRPVERQAVYCRVDPSGRACSPPP